MDEQLAAALADNDALKAALIRVERERDEARSNLRVLAEIVRGACASATTAADLFAPATVRRPLPVDRLLDELDADVYRAPVLRFPMRRDSKTAPTAASVEADESPKGTAS